MFAVLLLCFATIINAQRNGGGGGKGSGGKGSGGKGGGNGNGGGANNNGPRVGEWTDTSWSDNPFMVGLEIIQDDGNYLCGGSIIATDEHHGKGVILTAAHCVEGAQSVNVWVGCTMSNCWDELAEKYDDEYYTVHPDYDPSLASTDVNWVDNDIAVVFLDQAITVEGATSIELHHDIGFMENDAEIMVFGYYGTCASNDACIGGSDTDSLEYALTNYMISSECEDVYGQRVTGPHDFCVKDDFRRDGGLQSVCMGDSGSPALIDGKQIGLNSWGPGDCDPRDPTVLTSVPYYVDWISEQCPECVPEPDFGFEDDPVTDGDHEGGQSTPAVLEENMLFDMDQAVLFQDGASGLREAVSVRDIAFLVLEIAGLLIISAVAITVFYWRYTEKQQEEKKPLLNVMEV